jgi:ribosomal protein S25
MRGGQARRSRAAGGAKPPLNRGWGSASRASARARRRRRCAQWIRFAMTHTNRDLERKAERARNGTEEDTKKVTSRLTPEEVQAVRKVREMALRELDQVVRKVREMAGHAIACCPRGVILTTVATLRLQKRNVLQYLTEACRMAIAGHAAPSLVPPTLGGARFAA